MHSWTTPSLSPLRWLMRPGEGCGHPPQKPTEAARPSPSSVSMQPRKEVPASLQKVDRETGALGLLNTCSEEYNHIPLHRALNMWVGLTCPWKARGGSLGNLAGEPGGHGKFVTLVFHRGCGRKWCAEPPGDSQELLSLSLPYSSSSRRGDPACPEHCTLGSTTQPWTCQATICIQQKRCNK